MNPSSEPARKKRNRREQGHSRHRDDAGIARDDLADFGNWYDGTYIPEMLSVKGFRKVRRFESADGDSFLAVYEFDSDVDTAKAAAVQQVSPPVGVAFAPARTMRYFCQVTDSDE